METTKAYEKEITTLRKMLKEQQEINRKLEIEKSEEQRKFKKLSDRLKDKVECPVCLDTPRIGPVPVCTNGHVVCRSCKTQSCPTCRVDMGPGTSLIAVTVIENIEHECKFDECTECFTLDMIDDHVKVCSHRQVTCPTSDCEEEFPLSKLLDHLTAKTNNCSYALKMLIGDSPMFRKNIGLKPNRRSDSDLVWKVSTFSYDDKNFVVFPEKNDNIYYISVVMFASEEECSKYKIEIAVHEYDTIEDDCDTSFRFCGKPCSIDQMKMKQKYFGLSVASKCMEQILKNDMGFTISFSIAKK